MATLRNLKIKTGTCKRLVKEFHSYEKEVEREAAKTADMKGKGADPYDLKQQENVLAESRMMIPDCQKRLEASLAELKGTLVELEEELNQKKALKLKKLGPLLQKLISCSRQQKPSLPAFVTVTKFPWFSICSDTMCAPNKGRQCCLAIVFQGILVSCLYCYFKHMY